jgi:hypothetical protein
MVYQLVNLEDIKSFVNQDVIQPAAIKNKTNNMKRLL